jgi:hypothetical protein
MADYEGNKIERLTEHNYATWRQYVYARLIKQGLWDVVANGGDDATDKKAMADIIMCVSPSMLSLIDIKGTAKAAWGTLEKRHKTVHESRKVALRRELTNLMLDTSSNESITSYVGRADRLVDQLVAAGYKLVEDSYTISRMDIVLCVLAGLPQEYESAVSILESSEKNLKSLDYVVPQLLRTEERVKGSADDHDAGKAYKAKRFRPKGDKSWIRCYQCGEQGHVRAECPTLKPQPVMGVATYAAGFAL